MQILNLYLFTFWLKLLNFAKSHDRPSLFNDGAKSIGHIEIYTFAWKREKSRGGTLYKGTKI
ncbi:MAG TPA: hypothetical protein DDW76_27340 [Cyanobacteria bacterium UBA11369]|nr:hypothetical protein [Cyanobacteria bacterium UBA11368]HBE52385.1 hypothetical protein [Cyanobacteria bacterium UBA11369]